jgi:imidazolonepropionase-like amidohydrolase
MRAICEVAHGADRFVAAHCHGGPGIDMAIDAGVDTFEHGRFLTDEQLARMAELGRFLVPTLSPEARMADTGYQPQNNAENPHAGRWIEIATNVMYDTVARANRHGVRVAAGTDVGMPNINHGEVAYEMFHLAHAGLSNLTTIATGTRMAAEACDLGDSLGQVRPGYIADLVIVDGDPAQDISILRRQDAIRTVIQSGMVTVDRGLNGATNSTVREPAAATA